jgi:hypothetical protein
MKQMEFTKERGRFFYEGCPIVCYGFSTLKGSIQGREVNILINLDYNENYINIDFANQLLISESNIIEKKYIFQIKELQVTIDEYEYISQFYVTTMYREEIDIIIGLPWFKNLGTFILNMEKKFVTFPYKEKMITLQDTTSEPESVTPEDFNDISEVILHENKKAMQRMQKEFDEVIKDKNEEIFRLKDHSQKLLTQIKKSKDKKQCLSKLEQENQDLGKKLSKKNEETSRLKNLNQGLLEQIRKLKEEKSENPDIKNIIKSDNEENSRLKNHNQNLLMQIKKLKNDKKSLENKLELLKEKEASKFSDELIQVMKNGTITDPIHITTQEVARSTEKKTYSDVGVQTVEVSSVDPTTNKTTSNEEDTITAVNQGNTACSVRENHVTRKPYRHPNHKSRYLKQSECQDHLNREQQIYHPKNSDTNVIHSHNNDSSSWKCNISQKIELGWSDHFTIRQFCSALCHSYHLVSSILTTPKTENHTKTCEPKRRSKPLHKHALRTKHF